MDYLEGLNEKQMEAVSETEGYVRVIAGAGSGKTKLLVCRYGYLVREYGIDTSNILCVTFTNKAAGEMRARIRRIVGDENSSSLICTYHGFCARLLREDASKLFLPKNFQIIDTSQQKIILSEIYQKRELKLDYASFEKMLKTIGAIKTERYLEYVPRFCSPQPRSILSPVQTDEDEIVEEYLQRQKAIGGLDFNDLLSFALYLLETNDSVREKWQEKLNYIQVDEFQDSSSREMKLINILSEKYGNLMIVGDPDQNIYEWRGSDVRLLVDFDKVHQPTKTIFLNRNYRSTPQILKCANTLIDHNTLRLKKDLYTLAPRGADVIHYHSETEDDENKVITGIIKSSVQRGEKRYSDFAVLYRSGFLSRIIEKSLVEQNIPYEIYGGVRFYQRMEVQDIVAYLRLIMFNDDLSFKRVVNKPRRRFGRTKMAALEQLQASDVLMFSESSQPNLFDVLTAHLHESPFKSSDAEGFVKWVEGIRANLTSLRITEIVNRVSTESGYEQYIRELGDEERYENLMEFKRIADEFERNFGENLSLAEFLQQISLQAGEDTDKPKDAVKLMTIHASKGLEFPAVFLIGLTEGVFPSAKTIEERKLLGLEEERRLCYVAITRAEKELYLMDSEGMSQNGIKKLPSRFLREIGIENYVRIGRISKSLDCESRAYANRLNEGIEFPSAEDAGSSYAEGQEVTHHVFGKGKILAIDPARGTVRVQFENMKMPRNLSLDYFKEEHAALPRTERHEKVEKTATITETPIIEESATQPEEVSGKDQQVAAAALVELAQTDNQQPDEESDIYEDNEPAPQEEHLDESDGTESEGSEEIIETEEGESLAKDIDPKLLARLNEASNLWKRDDVPHSGWICTGITDLGEPADICEMCGHQIIRYVHHMVHPNYRPLSAGCVCAGKMEGNPEAAQKRERDLKNQQARLLSYKKKKWKLSKNGNAYLKIRGHHIVLYNNKNAGFWKYAIDSNFCEQSYRSRNDAAMGAFEALEDLPDGTKT